MVAIPVKDWISCLQMEQTRHIHDLLDATGGGSCCLTTDAMTLSCSPGFIRLTGANLEHNPGVAIHSLLPGLAALENLSARVEADASHFVQIGSDGVARELCPALIPEGADRYWLLLVDRTREARLLRNQGKLDRCIQNLQSELEVQEQMLRAPQLKTTRELARRLADSLQRSQRYGHALTVLSVQWADEGAEMGEEIAGGSVLLGCVRGVDDVGGDQNHGFSVILPHTDLEGAKIVAQRIAQKLREEGLSKLGIGVAQAKKEEGARPLVERSRLACEQSFCGNEDVLLAVDVV